MLSLLPFQIKIWLMQNFDLLPFFLYLLRNLHEYLNWDKFCSRVSSVLQENGISLKMTAFTACVSLIRLISKIDFFVSLWKYDREVTMQTSISVLLPFRNFFPWIIQAFHFACTFGTTIPMNKFADPKISTFPIFVQSSCFLHLLF